MNVLFFESLSLGASFSAENEMEHTSDKFERTSHSLDFKSCLVNIFWPYEKKCSEDSTWGLHLKSHRVLTPLSEGTGTQIAGSYGNQIATNKYFSIELGLHYLEIENKPLELGMGKLRFDWQTPDLGDLSFQISRDLSYSEMRLPAGITQALSSWLYQIQSLYRVGDRWRFPIKGLLRNYSDANSNWEMDAAAMFGISPGVPWIWFGFGVNLLGFQEQKSEYWTPRGFSAYGPRLEVNYPFVEKVSFQVSGLYNRIKEKDFPEAESVGLYSGFIYGSREETNLKFQYFNFRSVQASSTWNTEGFAMSFIYLM